MYLPWTRNLAKAILQHTSPFLWRLPRQASGGIGLTFDDGPHPEYTPRLLELLDRMGARATFFLIGERVARYPAIAAAIVAAGHTVGNHTWSHTEVTQLTPIQLADELRRTDEAIQNATGIRTRWFRPPRGRISVRGLLELLKKQYVIVHWSRTYSDYRQDGTIPLLTRMVRQPPVKGDIVLLHDHNPHTIDSVQVLADWASRAGFVLLSLEQALVDG